MACKHVRICIACPWKQKFLLHVGSLFYTAEILTNFSFEYYFWFPNVKGIRFSNILTLPRNFVHLCFKRVVTKLFPTVYLLRFSLIIL
jgi:hypothetical protein